MLLNVPMDKILTYVIIGVVILVIVYIILYAINRKKNLKWKYSVL